MANRDGNIQGIVVQIFGDEYQISSQGDPADVQRIADYVDEKMRTIAAQHAGRIPKATLAVLAAMEITSELFGTMLEQSRLTAKAQENLERLTRLVDERADLYASLLDRRSTPFMRILDESPVNRRDSTTIE
jgi:cell division protein ZapA (FtsZ GTPase activity inhibitor)